MTDLPIKTQKKLTLPESRLSGSDSCQNCGTELQGPYCHYCGQPDKNFFRFFPALLREMMGDLLDYDSRFTRTLKPLLFQPGKLASDYMQGKRFRYTSPVRLYLFSSIIFFVLASFVTNLNISESMSEIAGEAVETSISKSIPPVSETEVQTDVDQPEDHNQTKHGWFVVNLDTDETGAHEDIDLPFLPQSLNNWVNAELAKSEIKSEAISEDPTLITGKIFDLLPMTIFALLPLFALLLKAFYLFTNRYYTEHLIFALYNHSFLFVSATIMILIMMLVSTTMGMLEAGSWPLIVSEWAIILMWIWMGIYFWIAMKRYYQQGWILTTVKYLSIGILYGLLLGVVTTVIAIISFLLL